MPAKRARDWRATLFVWRGVLRCSAGALTWRGAWALRGPGEPEPSDETLSTSANTFECSGPVAEAADAPTLARALAGTTASWTSSTYLLDQGDGRGRCTYSDETHRVVFKGSDEGSGGGASATAGAGAGESASAGVGAGTLVAACGRTEFGAFVSLGRLTVQGADVVLTLARRYVDDADPRASFAEPRRALELSERLGEDPLPWRIDEKMRRVALL